MPVEVRRLECEVWNYSSQFATPLISNIPNEMKAEIQICILSNFNVETGNAYRLVHQSDDFYPLISDLMSWIKQLNIEIVICSNLMRDVKKNEKNLLIMWLYP